MLSSRFSILRILLLGGFALGSLGLHGALAQEADHDHVHGVGQLNVAVDGDLLLIELISPAMDLLGFAHSPQTETQRLAVDAARAHLQAPERLFAPTPAAGCVRIATEIEIEIELDVDVYASYAFDCQHPLALRELSIGFFETFPDARALRVQLLTETRQDALELSPDDQRLPL